MNRLLNFVCSFVKAKALQLWLGCLGTLVIAGAVEAQQFPYVAYVTGDQVYVRSGPGQRYYPTAQIPQGYAVEVYRHDGDGWCAIRPPEGSFSWVPSHQVRSSDMGIVEVVDDNVVTRVGSTMSPVRSAVQVLLPKGERIELIAAQANDDPRWVRVTPPAGEFRWVAASALSRQPPMEMAPKSQPTETGWSKQFDRTPPPSEAEPSVFDHLQNTHKSTQTGGLQFGAPPKFAARQQTPVTAETNISDPTAMDVVAGSPAELQLAQFQSQPADFPPPGLLSGNESAAAQQLAGQPRVRFQGMSPTTPATVGNVEELELRLSQTVIQPPKQWELAPLEAAAESLLAQTKAPPVRAQLREVLERITQFQQIQQRYNNPTVPAIAQSDPFEAPIPEAAGGLTGLSSTVRERARQDLAGLSPSASSTSSTTDKPLYDAAGTLKPVVSKRESAPQYALVDEQGKVVSFVTPTPDLNLKPYVGRHIGVHGTRGFIPEYRRAHVTAGRVTPIESTIRR